MNNKDNFSIKDYTPYVIPAFMEMSYQKQLSGTSKHENDYMRNFLKNKKRNKKRRR